MKAIVQDEYGSPEVLRVGEIDRPKVGDGEVLIRVHAAGVDPGVWHLMAGLPYFLRLMGYGLRAPKTRVPGNDFSGRVETVGKEVTQFQPGDDVFGLCKGCFAEYACAREDKIVPKPSNLTFEQAAAVPTSALTALQALRDKGEVAAGQRVLIIGASGGVGSFAVQLAKVFGAEVTGVCSTPKMDLVRSIGADHVVDYTREDIAQTGERYDVILDTAGNRSLAHLRRALTRKGTLVIVGGEEGGRWLAGADRQLRAALLSPLVSQSLRPFMAVGRQEDLEFLKGLVESGEIKPVVDRTYPLAEAPEAIRYLMGGHARGKLVLTV